TVVVARSFIYVVLSLYSSFSFFFFHAPPPTEIYTLSLHDALPIFAVLVLGGAALVPEEVFALVLLALLLSLGLLVLDVVLDVGRSEEHTSELQSRSDLVCRLLLEKKKKKEHQTLARNQHRHISRIC